MYEQSQGSLKTKRYIQSISQQQSLKRNVTAVVELAIHLQFVTSKIRNIDVVASLDTLQEATGDKQQRNYSSRPRQQQHF